MTAKAILLILLVALMAPVFQSCKKYDEGPGVSFRTREERVANRWQVENYKINGNDFTSLVSNYSETFTKKSGYSYTWGNAAGSGIWAFHDDDKEIRLVGNDIHSSRTLVIQKLEEKAFWYYYIDGTDKHELHLVPN